MLIDFWFEGKTGTQLFLFLQLLMCGTGDISVCDFKAHAVVVGGSWHFREKVSRILLGIFSYMLCTNFECSIYFDRKVG